MKWSKYSDAFYVQDYKGGIIVAFKNIGDISPSYADQIHQIVSNNFGVDLFVSDIIKFISCTEDHKEIIKDSLFIYVKNGVSISACGISLCPNKDYIEVKYYSDKVLTVQRKRTNRLWCVCILVLLCICGYNTIFDDDIIPDEPNVEIKEGEIDELSATIDTITPNNDEKQETRIQKDDKYIEEVVEVLETNTVQEEDMKKEVAIITPTVSEDVILIPDGSLNKKDGTPTTDTPNPQSEWVGSLNKKDGTPTSVKYHKLEDPHIVEAKVQCEREEVERDRKRKALKAEASEYLQIADQAYNEYADSFNESKRVFALRYFRKALNLNKKYGLFSVDERKSIERKVSVLENN